MSIYKIQHEMVIEAWDAFIMHVHKNVCPLAAIKLFQYQQQFYDEWVCGISWPEIIFDMIPMDASAEGLHYWNSIVDKLEKTHDKIIESMEAACV